MTRMLFLRTKTSKLHPKKISFMTPYSQLFAFSTQHVRKSKANQMRLKLNWVVGGCVWLRWQTTCLACPKPWALSLALEKQDRVTHIRSPQEEETGRLGAQGHKENPRPPRATWEKQNKTTNHTSFSLGHPGPSQCSPVPFQFHYNSSLPISLLLLVCSSSMSSVCSRVILFRRKKDHLTSLLKSLQWLPISPTANTPSLPLNPQGLCTGHSRLESLLL